MSGQKKICSGLYNCSTCRMTQEELDDTGKCGRERYESAQERSVAEDVVNQPTHYTSHPSGVECIQITEHMGFNLGNALKYIWRSDLKHDAIEDMKKAIFYLNREIDKREKK